MLARTQPSKGINHFTGATNTTKQQGIAGILRGFRQPGKGPHFELFLFTSGPTEKDPFFFFFPEWEFYLEGIRCTSVRNHTSQILLKTGTPFFFLKYTILSNKQSILSKVQACRDSQLCVYEVNKIEYSKINNESVLPCAAGAFSWSFQNEITSSGLVRASSVCWN